MLRYFEDYVDRLISLHNDYKKGISGLSVEALDWVPGRLNDCFEIWMAHRRAEL